MIATDKYEGHTRGPWKSIPYCKSIRDKLLHGGIILASSGIGDGSNYSPFIITDDDVVIWPKDTDGKNVVEYEHGAKGPILHIYYEEMMANTRLTMAAPDLLAEVKRVREALITVQRLLTWDEKDREMDGDPVTLEALVEQVEWVRSNIMEMIE